MQKWFISICITLFISVQYINAQKTPPVPNNEVGVIIKETISPGQIEKLEIRIKQLELKAKKLKEQKKYDEAIKCLKLAISETKPLWGENNIINSSLKMSLVSLCIKKQEYHKAAATLKQSMNDYKSSIAYSFKPENYSKGILMLVAILFNSSKYSEAQQELNSLTPSLPQLSKMKNNECLIKYYYWQAKLKAVANKPTQVIQNSKLCISQIGNDYTEYNKDYLFESYSLLYNALDRLNKTNEKEQYLSKSLNVCTKHYPKDKLTLGTQYYNFGTYYYSLDKSEKALVFTDKAIIAIESIKETQPYFLGVTLLLKGKCLAQEKKWELALPIFEKSINSFKNVDEKDEAQFVRDDTLLAYRWFLRACSETKKYNKGIVVFKKNERKLLSQPINKNSIAVILDAAVLFLDSKQYNITQQYCIKALSLASKLKTDKDLDLTINGTKWILALAYYKDKKLSQAISYGKEVAASKNAPESLKNKLMCEIL